MKIIKRILPVMLILLPYWFISPIFGEVDDNSQRFTSSYFYIWIAIFIVLFAVNVLHSAFRMSRGEKSEFFLFWSMILKLCHIPVYVVVFLCGVVFAIIPFGFFLLPILIIFDFLLLSLSSIYGISGIIQAKHDGDLSLKSAVVLGILHFFFCADVICSIVAFFTVKHKKSRDDTGSGIYLDSEMLAD